MIKIKSKLQEVKMNEKACCDQKTDLRADVREAASKGASIEFKPSGCAMAYHFPLRDISESGLGLLVNKKSDIFQHIQVGDVYHMKFHIGNATPAPEHLRVKIRHIFEPDGGKPPNHLIVGLQIIEKIAEEDRRAMENSRPGSIRNYRLTRYEKSADNN